MNIFDIAEWGQRIKRRRFIGQSGLIALLGALLLGGLWLYSWQQLSHDYDRTIAEGSQETVNLVKAFEEYVRRVIADADTELLRLKRSFERGELSNQKFTEDTASDPSKRIISIYNERGIVIQSSESRSINQNRSDRDHFTVQRDHADQKLYIGKTIIGKTSGDHVIPLSRRIAKPDGSFGGIVYISLSTDYFVEFYNKINLGPNQLISISGMDGFSRVRRVNDKITTGEDLSDSQFWRYVRGGFSEATYTGTTAGDEINRVISYRVMAGYPLIVTVGKSIQVVMTDYDQRKQTAIFGVSLVSFFIVSFCVLLIRRNEKTMELTAAVQQEKDRLNSLVDNMNDEVLFADTAKRYTLVNPAAARSFSIKSGTTSVEGLAASLEVLRADGSPRPVEEAPPLRALRGEVIHDEQEIIRIPSSGELYYREVNANPVRDTDGVIIGAVIVVRDISKRKQAEGELARLYQKAEEASRAKSEFLASMSHELRTPLNAIIGFSEVLKDQLFGRLNPKQDKYVDSILVSSRHLLDLINDILDLSKVEAGKVELEISRVNISEICRNTVALFQNKAAKRKVWLSFIQDPAIGDAVLFADERKIKQILYNLIDNGIKYNKPNGSLYVVVTKVDEGEAKSAIRIVVEDTGIGISSDDLPKLFKSFVQLSRVHSKPAEGTGLGLALTKYLVELHGGEIWVESELGKGSRFIVLIPVQREQNEEV